MSLTRAMSGGMLQRPLPLTETDGENLTTVFRRLYFHLYTNSNASRAERIVEDLSLILLLKLALEVNGGAHLVHYRTSTQTANEVLLPLLRDTFPQLVDEQQRFSIGDGAVRRALDDLDNVQLSTAPAHVLGEAFQAVIGPRLRGDKGQFFTPRSLVRAMIQVIDPKPEESLLDPACGTGGFLTEALIYQHARYPSASASGLLVGIDKDQDLARLAAALLAIASRGRGVVGNFNSLDVSQWSGVAERTDGDLYDVVLTNPPFGAKIGVRDRDILATYALGRQWKPRPGRDGWERTTSVDSAKDPQVLFLELCIKKLKPGGRLGIVLPEGVFGNKQEGYVWDWLRSQGAITALLDCPRTTFQPGTDTKTNVLFFQKFGRETRPTPVDPMPVRIAVAIHCGHDRRGRSRLSDGRPYPDDFLGLGDCYHIPADERSPWQAVRLTRTDYLVPRYYAPPAEPSAQEAELLTGARWATMGDLSDAGLITFRKGHEVGSDAYGSGDIHFVRTSDIANFEISADPTNAVSEEIYASFAGQQQLIPGDILMVVDGRYRIGISALLTERNCKCVVQSHLRIIGTPRREQLDPYELLFALNLPSVRLRIRSLVFIQSTLGTLGKRLLELRIPVLHGPGPWEEKVGTFRRSLHERDALLMRLREITGPEFEI